MFLGLDVATGKEGGGYDPPVETPVKETSDPGIAKAEFTQVVKGNPDNYKWDWVPGAKAYRYVINPDRTQPFETVAFWFRGVATKNRSVPEDVKIPKLDFTWKFSKVVETPAAVAPRLISVNGEPHAGETINVEGYVRNDPDDPNEYQVDDIVLGFDLGSYKRITNIQYSRDYTKDTWETYLVPYSEYSINGSLLAVKSEINGGVIFRATLLEPQYWKVTFVVSA